MQKLSTELKKNFERKERKSMQVKAHLMDQATMDRVITRIAHEILECNRGTEDIYLIGIQRRGVPLAKRIAAKIKEIENVTVGVGILDITFYRDDLSLLAENPIVNDTQIDINIYGAKIILVDDVLYTGRTVRAAIEAIFDMGRPNSIQLAVLIDRGHRELPFRPDYVGKNVPTSRSEMINVEVEEIDGKDQVLLVGPEVRIDLNNL